MVPTNQYVLRTCHRSTCVCDWTEKCVGKTDPHMSSCGFLCTNDEALHADKTYCNKDQCSAYGLGKDCNKCPNLRVQFFCMGEKPDPNTCCPYSSACQSSGDRSLRSSLSIFSSEVEKRDVIADILYEVEDALQPTG